MIDLAPHGGLGEHLGGLLEGRCRDERFRRERSLGDPQQQGLGQGRLLVLLGHAQVGRLEGPLLHVLPHQEVGVTDVGHLHPAQHLANDDFDVLVVDLDALKPVDLLHLIHQILRQLLLALDLQDVVRIGGAVHQRVAGDHPIALVDADVLALRDQVFLGLRLFDIGGDHDLALAARVGPEGDHPVDLAHDCEILGLARLEELRHSGQTSGDILGLGGFPGHLGKHVTRSDRLPLGYGQVGTHREQRTEIRRAGWALDGDTRAQLRVLGFDDDPRGDTGELVHLLLHRGALDDIPELHRPRHLRQNRIGEGIPLEQHRPSRNVLAVFHENVGAVHHRMMLSVAAARVADLDLSVAIHRDLATLAIFHGSKVLESDLALGRGLRV